MPKAVQVDAGDCFGSLTVIGVMKEPGENAKCLTQCACGAFKTIWKHNLTSGHTTSCGCAKVEAGRSKRTHGQSHGRLSKGTPTYKTWSSMKWRAGTAKGYEHVTVCERWHSFENFLADMGERPEGMTIDRIDPSKGYDPDNCRWASKTEQSYNRREWKHTPEGLERIKMNLPNMH